MLKLLRAVGMVEIILSICLSPFSTSICLRIWLKYLDLGTSLAYLTSLNWHQKEPLKRKRKVKRGNLQYHLSKYKNLKRNMMLLRKKQSNKGRSKEWSQLTYSNLSKQIKKDRNLNLLLKKPPQKIQIQLLKLQTPLQTLKTLKTSLSLYKMFKISKKAFQLK